MIMCGFMGRLCEHQIISLVLDLLMMEKELQKL